MPDLDDMQLLEEYASRNSEEAFAELVRRRINLVYTAALRQVGDSGKAQDVTQAVFIILAKKAGRLRKETLLTGWLYQTTRLCSASLRRGEMRRHHREQEAFMQSTNENSPTEPAWKELAPVLDDAIARLGEKERSAILLRYFEGYSTAAAAAALDVNESALKARVNRGVEKLRKFFVKRGIPVSVGALSGALGTHSVEAAPAALAKTATAVAVTKGATASVSTLTLIQGTLKIMAWTKMKTVVITGAVILLTVGVAVTTPKLIERHLKNKMRAEMNQTAGKVKSRQLVDETQGATVIDLKPFINTALMDSPSSPKNITANNLSELPKGTNIYGGVPFDVEGTIQLMGKCFEKYGKVYPVKIENISIGRTCARLHLFHGESYIPWEQSGMPVAKLVLHYASGAEEELNLVAGAEAFDFWGPTTRYNLPHQPEIKPAADTELAWTGTNPWVQKWVPQFRLRLYRTTFSNPRPAEVISSCDYVSTLAEKTAPFLAGLTVE